MPLEIHQRAALRLLSTATNGSFYIWGLAGPSKDEARQRILSNLLGQKVSKAKSGVRILQAEFYALSGVTGTCEADKEDKFIVWAKENVDK